MKTKREKQRVEKVKAPVKGNGNARGNALRGPKRLGDKALKGDLENGTIGEREKHCDGEGELVQ